MKRLMDIAFVSIGLCVLAPVLVLVAILIRVKLGSPILFRQKRPGREGVPFMMYKFRSMTDDRDALGELLPDKDRLVPFGQFLRSSSLDEFPALWNVLKGDMSLVGPRPLLMEYIPLYSMEQMRRHEVRPGITGWAQANGRNSLSWEEKFKLDVWYVDHQSVWLDIKIIFLTVKKVLIREGISAQDEATMSRFKGNATMPKSET